MPDEAYWQTFFNPECIVSKLDCAGGDVVEFGCGYGLFTVPAAKRVSGTVYGLDIEPDMVAATAKHAAEIGCSNVVAEQRDFLSDGCGPPDASASYAMLFNILHIAKQRICCGRFTACWPPVARRASSIGRWTRQHHAARQWQSDRSRISAGSGQSVPASDSCAVGNCAAVPGTGEWLSRVRSFQ